mgnify:CR=1 FL=1
MEVPLWAGKRTERILFIDIIRAKLLLPMIVGSITLDCREGKAAPMSGQGWQTQGQRGSKSGGPQTTKDSIPAIFLRHYPEYKSGQLNVSELARVCDLSRTTIYKYIDLLEE